MLLKSIKILKGSTSFNGTNVGTDLGTLIKEMQKDYEKATSEMKRNRKSHAE